jgi:hypothetical protein
MALLLLAAGIMGLLTAINFCGLRPFWLVAASFYGGLTLASAYALWRIFQTEKCFVFDAPQRLLILAPHQDDCVICAGGIGIRNQRLNGTTYVAYLVQDENPGMPERRREEAIAAWAIAGIPSENLFHLNILPRLAFVSATQMEQAAVALQTLMDSVKPTLILMPLFEGGHIHHDLTNYLVSFRLKLPSGMHIFECPEYSPYLSLRKTPHRIISLCARWLGGVVSYYGPPDGIDGRPVLKLALSDEELELKRKMFLEFKSQNGKSLSQTRNYPDRVIEWTSRAYRAQPFDYNVSYARFVLRLEKYFPARWVRRLFPGQLTTFGREPGITNLDKEFHT